MYSTWNEYVGGGITTAQGQSRQIDRSQCYVNQHSQKSTLPFATSADAQHHSHVSDTYYNATLERDSNRRTSLFAIKAHLFHNRKPPWRRNGSAVAADSVQMLNNASPSNRTQINKEGGRKKDSTNSAGVATIRSSTRSAPIGSNNDWWQWRTIRAYLRNIGYRLSGRSAERKPSNGTEMITLDADTQIKEERLAMLYSRSSIDAQGD